MPANNYKELCVLASGEHVVTLEIRGGADGGFSEARPYSIVNVFLCLRKAEDYAEKDVVETAAAALNNVIELYRLITMDPLGRPLRFADDSYYTLVSMGQIPSTWPDYSAEETLLRIGELNFGSTIGVDRVHHIGLNSYEDLISVGSLKSEHSDLLYQLVKSPYQLEVLHQLFLSAIRRIKWREYALAIVDAQSSVEAAIAIILTDALRAEGMTDTQISTSLASKGKYHLLGERLKKIDEIGREHASTAGRAYTPFKGSRVEEDWKNNLYDLRHRVVHEGFRGVGFNDAKKAVVAGLKMVHAVQNLSPSFRRPLMWGGSYLDLPNIQLTAGRLFRLFEG